MNHDFLSQLLIWHYLDMLSAQVHYEWLLDLWWAFHSIHFLDDFRIYSFFASITFSWLITNGVGLASYDSYPINTIWRRIRAPWMHSLKSLRMRVPNLAIFKGDGTNILSAIKRKEETSPPPYSYRFDENLMEISFSWSHS